jgi:hypothetical protein
MTTSCQAACSDVTPHGTSDLTRKTLFFNWLYGALFFCQLAGKAYYLHLSHAGDEASLRDSENSVHCKQLR